MIPLIYRHAFIRRQFVRKGMEEKIVIFLSVQIPLSFMIMLTTDLLFFSVQTMGNVLNLDAFVMNIGAETTVAII